MSAQERLKKKAAKLFAACQLIAHCEEEARIRRSNVKRAQQLWKEPTEAQASTIEFWDYEASAFDYLRTAVLDEHARVFAESIGFDKASHALHDMAAGVTYARAVALKAVLPDEVIESVRDAVGHMMDQPDLTTCGPGRGNHFFGDAGGARIPATRAVDVKCAYCDVHRCGRCGAFTNDLEGHRAIEGHREAR